ncbi:MAG: 3-oxoacyl-ACP synthase [Prevotella sp.]|nr:3-oxoacyl-ACP synthase [Candidatus Prevotella equi]
MFLKATNITSPLGLTTEENYAAVRNGLTGVRCYEAGVRDVPFAFCASLFDESKDFVQLAVYSIQEALSHTDIDVASSRTLFVLSTTKGVIGTSPSVTAKEIADAVGVTTAPIVVCNACISGVAAQILALRLINSRSYDNVIVTGCDVQSKFIISGFNCLKALSPEPCRPYDEERLGLNLGEGAATMIFSSTGSAEEWQAVSGAIRNDAYHISGPHPQGEGCYLALTEILKHCDRDSLAAIGVHGTATMYNDQMESKAIMRAGMSDVPLSALKGYYGHTMGAAGVIETIITARALDDGLILPSKGFNEIGVSGKVTISSEMLTTEKRSFIKMLSGFGGCNGAILYTKNENEDEDENENALRKVASVTLSSNDNLTAIYKEQIGGYPKYYKMDTLSRLAFIAAELLQKQSADNNGGTDGIDAVILFNRTSSCISDADFLETIKDAENFFPSPSIFVYTLPNITTGEIALRHAVHGETSFYILQERNDEMMQMIMNATLQDEGVKSIMAGWIDAESNDNYTIELNKYIL